MYSPDTDVYHIGLTLLDPSVHDVYVQLSNISSVELRLLQLLLSFRDDPDLSLLLLLLRLVCYKHCSYAVDVIKFLLA